MALTMATRSDNDGDRGDDDGAMDDREIGDHAWQDWAHQRHGREMLLASGA